MIDRLEVVEEQHPLRPPGDGHELIDGEEDVAEAEVRRPSRGDDDVRLEAIDRVEDRVGEDGVADEDYASVSTACGVGACGATGATSCVDGSIVVAKVLESKGDTFGFDAQTETYGDLVASGIVDPTKVVRTALQDAASVAGLLVTTEAMVAEHPKKDMAPAMPAGGGMGGMDF